MKQKFDAFKLITDKIVSMIESGKLTKWAMPWDQVLGADRNLDNRLYNGANWLILGFTRMGMGFTSAQWGSYKAITDKGGTIKKGEKGSLICYWNWIKRPHDPPQYDHDGKELEKSIGFLKGYNVFNLDQTEGLDHLRPAKNGDRKLDPIHEADKLIGTWEGKPEVKHGGDSACYSPSKDVVQMPMMDQFHSSEDYYKTLFHELAHSTGHASRLDRLEKTGFGTDPYAKEELIAELGSAFLCAVAGISEERLDEKSAAYMQHWAAKLKKDKKLFVHAASAANKAAGMVSEAYVTERDEAEGDHFTVELVKHGNLIL